MKQLASFRNNVEKRRFELQLGQAIAVVEYISERNALIIYNTEIPDTISSIENINVLLINEIIDHCRLSRTELIIQCPFAKAIFESLRRDAQME